jgi:hypothetical protein
LGTWLQDSYEETWRAETSESNRGLDNIVTSLFPSHQIKQKGNWVPVGNFECFNMEELEKADSSMKRKKATGSDEIPGEIIKLVFQEKPDLLLKVYNASLVEGLFPKQWISEDSFW